VVTAPASLRERLELAVIEDLKAISYLADVRAYDGELGNGDEDKLDTIKRSLNGINPGVLVSTGAGKFSTRNTQRRRYTREVDVQLVLVTRSVRSRVDQRHGPLSMYRLLEDVLGRLCGWDAGVEGVGPMAATSEEPFIQEPDLCVWLVRLTAETDFSSPNRAEIGAYPLEELAGTVNHAEDDGGVLVQGTGDSLTVAAGVVTLVDAGMAAAAGWVGLRVRIESAENDENEGDFVITAAPSATQIQFSNAAGLPETSSFTWKLLAPAPVTLTREVEQP
jgi:hypothetical protein